jgi:hypothetical protein
VAAVLPEYFAAANLNGAMPDEELSMMVKRSGTLPLSQSFAKLKEQ